MFSRPKTELPAFWRIADLVCAVLMVFYILFNVLDLDGSNDYRVLGRVNHIDGMVGEADSELRIEDSFEACDLRFDSRLLAAQVSNQFTSTRRLETPAIPLTAAGHSHGDRGCRREFSAADTPPYH